jgi:hypothetical protein
VEIILAALLAGVATGAGKAATSAVQDAYKALRDALRRRLADKPDADQAVDQYVNDPEAWEGNLKVQLKRAGVDTDREILDAAKLVMQSADPNWKPGGKYIVTVTDAKGVQMGDGSTQTNNF